MELRKILYELCCTYADSRIRVAQEAIQQAQQAANMEEKSTAGDKYETGRAMAHLEKEKAPCGAFKYAIHPNSQPSLLTNFSGRTFIAKPSGSQGHFGT